MQVFSKTPFDFKILSFLASLKPRRWAPSCQPWLQESPWKVSSFFWGKWGLGKGALLSWRASWGRVQPSQSTL